MERKLGMGDFWVRQVTEEDMLDIVEWWKARSWPAEAKEQVSTMGFVVEKDQKKICAGWLFVTNGPWAWLEFIVSNPAATLRQRAEGLEYLIRFALGVAKDGGYRIVTSNLSNRGLIKMFEKCGFVKGDQGVTNMIARVN